MYVSRTRAIRQLQLSLQDFRRLCILKGVYPREPKNKKKVGKGNSANKTYYFTKDIQYLQHEPLIMKFRAIKTFLKRLKKATAKKEDAAVQRLKDTQPVVKIDHIVRERYPTFIDAVRDLDDAICMVALFAQMPQAHKVQTATVINCKRLYDEFQHYIIATRSLRKVFLSIKGIYYQAEIMGQTVTWITPYKFNKDVPENVDFRIMDTFLLFYTTLLGFLNLRLYKTLNLVYPPKLDARLDDEDAGLSALIVESTTATSVAMDTTDDHITADEEKKLRKKSERRIKTLQSALETIAQEPSATDVDSSTVDSVTRAGRDSLDEFPDQMEGGEETIAESVEAKAYLAEMTALSSLFENVVFFLSREVPRYTLEFVILAFGGKLSWAGMGDEGAGPFPESDARITHHIVDRPKFVQSHLGRHYCQPQWIYDCVNARKLLSTAPYAVGALLPPHLSPFVTASARSYVPPEMLESSTDGRKAEVEEDDEEEVVTGSSDEEEEEEEDDSDEAVYRKELAAEARGDSYEKVFQASKGKVSAKPAKKTKTDGGKPKDDENTELAKMMMPKKHQRLYNRIMHSQGKQEQEKETLQKKRKAHDSSLKKEAKRGKHS